MRAVHPVFHVSQLELATPNIIPNRVQPPSPPVEVDGEPEYEIAEILDSKLDRRRRQCPLLYLVRWAGYEGTDEETSWLVANELGHALVVFKSPVARPAKNRQLDRTENGCNRTAVAVLRVLTLARSGYNTFKDN